MIVSLALDPILVGALTLTGFWAGVAGHGSITVEPCANTDTNETTRQVRSTSGRSNRDNLCTFVLSPDFSVEH